MNSESFGGGWLERNENSPRGKKKKRKRVRSIQFVLSEMLIDIHGE